MSHMHPVLGALMLACVVVATVCCWAAGNAVSRRARAGSVVMTGSMVVLLVPVGAASAVPVAALLLLVAMVGTVGRRGRAGIREDAHRSIGTLLMAVMVLQGASWGAASVGSRDVPSHGMHQSAVTGEWGILLVALMALLAWTLMPHGVASPRAPGRAGRWTAWEGRWMVAALAAMWLAMA